LLAELVAASEAGPSSGRFQEIVFDCGVVLLFGAALKFLGALVAFSDLLAQIVEHDATPTQVSTSGNKKATYKFPGGNVNLQPSTGIKEHSTG
jgi:hypothetical protein